MEIDFSAIITSLLSAGGLLALLEIGRTIHGAFTGRAKDGRERVKEEQARLENLQDDLDKERTTRIRWQDAYLHVRHIARIHGATDEELGDYPGKTGVE